MSEEYYDDSFDSDSNLPQYARITFFDQNPYLMQKERVIIGRNSAAGSVDIDVGSVTFVSRKHLELTYSYQKLKVKCLGKNGIFIDNNFKSHSFIPYELPAKSTLRFPSTEVQFCVEQLVGIKLADRMRSYGRLKNNNVRYMTENDESPDYKRMKLDCRSEEDSTSNENPEPGFQGFREVIGNLTDNEVEDYIHNEENDDLHKINNADCDELINNPDDDNDGVLIDSIGSYSFDINGPINNVSKDYSHVRIKPNQIRSTNILRGIDNHSSVSNRSSVTKLVFNNVNCSNDAQYYSSDGQFPVLDQDDLTIEHGSDTQKPPYSYAQLIVQAVSTARDRQLTLNGIYNYISKNYPYFKAHDKGWQNSVRHNLSLNRYFLKIPRGQDEPGKGSFWRVDPTYENKLISQAFRKRRLRNNASGIISENGLMSQVLNVSSIDSNSQTSCNNAKVFGVNKSCHLTSNRTSNFSNVITLKRASDISTQNGATTYMLSGSGLSSNGEPQKYIVSNRNTSHSNFESLVNGSTNNKTSDVFKCQQSSNKVFINGGSIKITGATNVTSKSRPLHLRSPGNNNSGTLISLGGRLFSTTNIKSLQIQQPTNSQPRFLSNVSFDSSNSKTAASIDLASNCKGNNYYIISPSTVNNQKILNSSFDENNSIKSQISLTGSNRRIITIQSSQSANIQKLDRVNGNMTKDSPLKSPIIFKKINVTGGNFGKVMTCDSNNMGATVESDDIGGRYRVRRRSGCVVVLGRGQTEAGDHDRISDNYPDNVCSDDDIKIESDSHVFIDNSEMDQFLISHSDPSVVSALPLHSHSTGSCSSTDLYKHDDMWPEDEVTKIESLKYGMHDVVGVVDPECGD